MRVAATGAIGCWLASAEVLRELAGRAELAQQAIAWVEAICTALLDPAHAVSAAGFDAIRCAHVLAYAGLCSMLQQTGLACIRMHIPALGADHLSRP